MTWARICRPLTLVAWRYLLIFPRLQCIKVRLGQSRVITLHLINTPHTPNTDTSFTPKSIFFPLLIDKVIRLVLSAPKNKTKQDKKRNTLTSSSNLFTGFLTQSSLTHNYYSTGNLSPLELAQLMAPARTTSSGAMRHFDESESSALPATPRRRLGYSKIQTPAIARSPNVAQYKHVGCWAAVGQE